MTSLSTESDSANEMYGEVEFMTFCSEDSDSGFFTYGNDVGRDVESMPFPSKHSDSGFSTDSQDLY